MNIVSTNRLLSAAILAAIAAPFAFDAAFAATPINETRPLSPTGSIDVSNVVGKIQVRACQCNTVAITGSLGKDVEKLDIDGDNDHLDVKVKYPKNVRHAEPTILLLTVPLQANLDIDGVAVEIDVRDVAPKKLSINSVSGNVFVAAAPKELESDSVSGDQNLTVNSSDVEIDSVSGNVVLRGRLDGKVKAETVSGDIDVQANPQHRLHEFSATTVSGNATLQATLARDAEVKMETLSGDVRAILPKDLSAQVTAQTFSGDIRAPGASVQKPKFGPGANLDARYGNGEGKIDLHSFSGDAELKLE